MRVSCFFLLGHAEEVWEIAGLDMDVGQLQVLSGAVGRPFSCVVAQGRASSSRGEVGRSGGAEDYRGGGGHPGEVQ
jgi:hypothetical protein